MKKFIIGVLLVTAAFFPVYGEEESIDDLATNTDQLWRPGAGAQDGAFTALSTSMLGWGLGLAAGVGLLAAIIHQSNTAHAHSD